MKFVENSEILSNERVLGNCYKMVLRAPNIAKNSVPGQFIEIECGKNNFPLLKRPISIHNAEDDQIEIIYYVVGKGTELLSEKSVGDTLETVGPLGKGFDLVETENHILVGGGYGVPPMYFLAKSLLKNNGKEKIFVCIGAKNKDLILCKKEFMDLGINLCVTTDDGSMGLKGFVTGAVKSILDNNEEKTAVYSCGPCIMMKNLYNLCKDYSQVENIYCSMEHIMACGVGVCNGCVLEIKEGESINYKRVCKDGPVFRGEEIVW